MTLSEFRESKFFKAVADISVVHWFFTVGPGLASGVAAAMHGKPLETVILYFVGVCALMLIVLHVGTLVLAKYWPKIIQNEANEAPRKSWRLAVPALALAIMLGFGWLVKSKPDTSVATSNGPSAPQSSQLSPVPSRSAASSVNGKTVETGKTRKGHSPIKSGNNAASNSQECAAGAKCAQSNGQTGGITAVDVTVNPPVNPNAAVKTYDYDGTLRIIGPGVYSAYSGKKDAFQTIVKKADAGNWKDVLAIAQDETHKTPEWLTPYFDMGYAYMYLCNRPEAIKNFKYFSEKASGGPTFTNPAYQAAKLANVLESGKWPDFVKQCN